MNDREEMQNLEVPTPQQITECKHVAALAINIPRAAAGVPIFIH
jgi:hypothetical protein